MHRHRFPRLRAEGTSMTRQAFETLTRRASLAALGAAGLTSLGSRNLASAKKKKTKKKGDVNKLCKKQVGQCFTIFATPCAADPICLARVERCCPKIGTCDFSGLIECLQAAMETAAGSALPRLGRT
jgi:hypothetical protein